MTTPTTLLILLALLQIKHMFADFFWQTPRMLAHRDRYVHTGRAQHAGLHALGSVLTLLVVGTSLPLILAIILAEWVAHYHIDWGKGLWSERFPYTPADGPYWKAVGVDQALHQLTYLAIAWSWIVWA